MNSKKNTILIIPAYEPSHNFVDYANELIDKGFGGIVVVNDGSGEKYDSVFTELSAIPSCRVISYMPNHGKGYALKQSFKYCLDTYDENYVFVTADCDGQHLAKDVENVANTALEHPTKLILGSRDFSLDSVPARSKAGNLNIRRLFKFFYGISLTDTQTGLRAFSYRLLEKLISIKGDRFEYEMNMLIVFHKSHIDILEVPIDTVYLKKEDDVDKVSHFKTFSDSVRVTVTLFQNLGWYLISSLLSALVDMGAFFILSTYLFVDSDSIAYNMLLATASARVISSIVNFTFNFKLVFNGRSLKSIIKYYILWAIQLCTSYCIALLWNTVFDGISGLTIVQIGLLTTLCKSICDLLVATVSYQVQSRWVFVSLERSRVYFYGTIFRIFRLIYSIFKKRYTSFVIPHESEPAVYICKGSSGDNLLRATQSLTFDLHPALPEKLLNIKDCRKHFSTYTFTEKKGRKGVARFFGRISAFFAATVFVPLAKALRAIAINNDCECKYIGALKYLEKRENILVFIPNSSSDEEKKACISEILKIEKLSLENFDRHIPFNVIEIDTNKREISQVGSFAFNDSEEYFYQADDVSSKILNVINN